MDDPFDHKKLSEYLSMYSSSSSSDSNNSDSSDLDEEAEQGQAMSLRTSFGILKQMLLHERIMEVEEEIVEKIRINRQEIQNKMNSRIERATVLKQFELTNLKHKFLSNKQGINQNFENDKEILYDTIKSDLEEKIQQLEEERNEVDIDAALWLDPRLTRTGRGRGRRPYGHVQSKRKPVIVSRPCIVHNLKEHEILEDWTIIKKSLSSSKRKENAEHRYKPYN